MKQKLSKKTNPERIKKLQELTQKFIDAALGSSIKVAEEEAYTRTKFIDNIESIFGGAAIEYFKCMLHDRLNLKSEFRSHWEKEWRGELGSKLQKVILHPIKFRDPAEAFQQAIQEEGTVIESLMTTAVNTIAKYFDLRPKQVAKLIDPVADGKAFFDEATRSYEAIVSGTKIINDPEPPWDGKPRKPKKEEK